MDTVIIASRQVISPGQVYTLEAFKLRTGWTDNAYRQAKRRGLKVVPSGKRIFVRGDDFIQFINSIAESRDAEKVALNGA